MKAQTAAHGLPLQPAGGMGHAGAAPGAQGMEMSGAAESPDTPGTASDKWQG